MGFRVGLGIIRRRTSSLPSFQRRVAWTLEIKPSQLGRQPVRPRRATQRDLHPLRQRTAPSFAFVLLEMHSSSAMNHPLLAPQTDQPPGGRRRRAGRRRAKSTPLYIPRNGACGGLSGPAGGVPAVRDERSTDASAADAALGPGQFLSRHGQRGLSKFHQTNPYVYKGNEVHYEPGESASKIKGGTRTGAGRSGFPCYS